MSKPVIKYVELHGGCCGLSTERNATILLDNGRSNVARIRNATKAEVAWVQGMGGHVPDGRIRRQNHGS